MCQLTQCHGFSNLGTTPICSDSSYYFWMLISTVYLGSLENVWIVQLRHLLALETPTWPRAKDVCPVPLVHEPTRESKRPKLFPPPRNLVLNYHSEHIAF